MLTTLATRPAVSNQVVKKIAHPIDLLTNHYSIKYIGSSNQIYQYQIEIDPPIEKDARAIMEQRIRLARP
jgi:hypothetical protein